jgi:hypothetical protein
MACARSWLAFLIRPLNHSAAHGHASSGDLLILAGYIGTGDGFAEALAKFDNAYADPTEKDWKELCRTEKGGKK